MSLSLARRQRWPLWFWVLTILAPVIFIGLMQKLEGRSTLGDRWHVTSAEYLSSDEIVPPTVNPGSQVAWQPVTMPQKTTGDPFEPASGWLRIAIPQTDASSTSEWMLFVPEPNNANYSLWASGVRFARTGNYATDNISMPKNPVSLEFPQLALRDGDTHVYLHITNELGGIDLNRIYLGPTEALRAYSDHATFVKKTLIRAILLMMGVMAMAMFMIHLLRRAHTSLYGWYTLGVAVWFAHILQTQHESASFGSAWFWYRVIYVTLPMYVAVGIVFVNRLTERPQPKLELAVLLVMVLGSAYILIDPLGVPGLLYFNSVFWIPAIIVGGLYMMVRLITGAGNNPNTHTLLLLAATFLSICVGIRDYLHNNLQIASEGMLYTRHAAGLVLVAYSFVMIRLFAESDILVQKPADKNASTTSSKDRTISPAESQRLVLQQEHNALERQLQKAVLTIEPTEGSLQFNQGIRAARFELQLIRDIMDHDPDAVPGALLDQLQIRISQWATEQPVPLIWETPLIDDSRYLAGIQEVALARFLQTVMLEIFSMSAVTSIKAFSASQRATMVVTIDTFLENPASAVFVKRAQMEAAARDLNGLLVFTPEEQKTRITLSWESIS